MKNFTNKTLAIAAIVGLMSSTSISANAKEAKLADNTYVTISGEVQTFGDKDTFHLKYWDGDMLVDVNDGHPDLFNGNMKSHLNIGDKVVVSGVVDDHMLTENEIDATRIDVIKGDNVTTYDGSITKSKLQNVGLPEYYSNYNVGYITEGQARISGYISEVPNDHQVILNYGTQKMLIELNGLELSKPALFTEGDFVVIEGTFDKGLLNSTTIKAANITKVSTYQVIEK